MKRKNATKCFTATLAIIMCMMFSTIAPQVGMATNTGLPFAITAEAASVTYYPKCGSNYKSIVDALKSIGVDSSYKNRKSIAQINGISNYTGSASQNTTLLNLLKQGKLIKSKSNTVQTSTNGAKAVYSKAAQYLNKRYGSFSGCGFHWRAWCADYVSWCAKNAGQSKAIPWRSAVSDLRTAIKNAGGKEYSKATVINGKYTPVRGDIIIFKSNGASHVGIVDYTKNGRIYYIDGNNTTYGNGNNSCVHYSNCSVSYSKFTCVLRPNYR